MKITPLEPLSIPKFLGFIEEMNVEIEKVMALPKEVFSEGETLTASEVKMRQQELYNRLDQMVISTLVNQLKTAIKNVERRDKYFK